MTFLSIINFKMLKIAAFLISIVETRLKKLSIVQKNFQAKNNKR